MMDIQRVAVIGAGTMGHGIAQVAAAAGLDVRLYDVSDEFVTRGLERIRANLNKGVARGKVTEAAREHTLECLSGSTDLAVACDDVDLVIEAAPETFELKVKIFRNVAEAVGPGTILATNTSSLSVSRIAASVPHPERFIGMHFFNPVHILKLLEVVTADQTAEATLDAVRVVGEKMGKELIVVRDSPGFASSRLGIILGLEAIRMVEDQVASPQDIDRAMELGYRHPMGPLKLTDLVGLDVRLAIAEHLHSEIGEQFRPPDLLKKMVKEGKLGKKSGQGFYNWSEQYRTRSSLQVRARSPVPSQTAQGISRLR